MSNQTRELARWLHDHLSGRKYPFRVSYGPERTERWRGSAITLERDNMTSETVGTASGTQKNGRKMRTRRLPVVIKIYAQASTPGANHGDHEELVDYLVDALVTGLEIWATSQRAGVIDYGEMAFMTPDELAHEGKPDQWSGAAYVMRFTIGRGVVERDYLKGVQPTATINGVGSTVEVRQFDEDGDPIDPEIVQVTAEEDP
jgi:hypothetical protein